MDIPKRVINNISIYKMNKNTEITPAGSALEALKAIYPQHVEDSYEKTILPQIRFKAKAVLDENQEKVVLKAGTLVVVTRSEEKDANDKYTYEEVPVGTSITADVLYDRYRLSYYDSANNTYISSPVFDNKEEVVKLFSGGKEYASGTVQELQALPEFTIEEDGKKRCRLQLQKVLYVFYNGAIHEIALSVGNSFAFRKYKQETVVPLVHTVFDSKKTEHGGNKYNEMTFTAGAYLTEEEAQHNLELVTSIKDGISAEKAFYGQAQQAQAMTALPSGDNF